MAGRTKSQSKSKLPKHKLFAWGDHLQIGVEKRAEGHAKTGALLARIINNMTLTPARTFLYRLSNMGFYGADIWYGFETYCRSDIDMFIACIEIEDKGFGDSILEWKAQRALAILKGEN